VLELEAEFFFDRPIGRFRFRQELVEVPAFRHPAAGDRFDDASRHAESRGQARAADKDKGCAPALQLPRQQAAGEPRADDEMSGICGTWLDGQKSIAPLERFNIEVSMAAGHLVVASIYASGIIYKVIKSPQSGMHGDPLPFALPRFSFAAFAAHSGGEAAY
jgi:hypothetical protein